MNRRSLLSYLGASTLGGFLGNLLGLRLKPEACPTTFPNTDELKDHVKNLVLKCPKCGLTFDPIHESKAFDEHKHLPNIITPDHPEAQNVEVIGVDGRPVKCVFEVYPRLKAGHQWKLRPSRECSRARREMYTKLNKRPLPSAILELDESGEPIAIPFSYSHLRMKDGRDVLEVFGV